MSVDPISQWVKFISFTAANVVACVCELKNIEPDCYLLEQSPGSTCMCRVAVVLNRGQDLQSSAPGYSAV